MPGPVSSILHDVNITTSVCLNNTALRRFIGHFERRIQTTSMELLLHCELIRTDICQNPTTRVANRVARIGDTLAIGERTHINLVMQALYNGCVRNTPIMLICKRGVKKAKKRI